MATNGYKPIKKIYFINIEELPGLSMRCGSIALGTLVKVQNLAGKSPEELLPAEQTMVFRMFTNKLISWNVVHPEIDEADDNGSCVECGLAEGEPLPATLEGLGCLEPAFVMDLIKAWINAIASVTAPKDKSSNNGGTVESTLVKQLGELQSPLKSQQPSYSLD